MKINRVSLSVAEPSRSCSINTSKLSLTKIKDYSKQLMQICLLPVAATYILNGCNGASNAGSTGNGTNSNSAYFNGAKIAADAPQSVPMNIAWSIDGLPLGTSTDMYDTSTHLLTLTAAGMPAPLATPVPVKGVQAIFNPVPTDNRGESITVTDINCKDAVFSKNGDTCSVYLRVSYDTSISPGESKAPVMFTQFATGDYPEISGVLSINYMPLFEYPQGDYRVVSPIETKYYTGSAVASNPNQYQILSMQNLANPPLTITNITKLTNTTFTLLNRESSGASDPYYGAYSQCALTANTALNQVNYLPGIGSECLLVYQAATSSNHAIESDSISLETDAGVTAPWSVNTLKLLANYVTGESIPYQTTLGAKFLVEVGSAHSSGTSMIANDGGAYLDSGTINPSATPFNLVNVSYDFKPKNFEQAPYGTSYYQNGVINIANQEIYSCSGGICGYSPTLFAGQQILTDASSTNPVTAGKVTQVITSGSSASNSGSVTACGGAWTSSSASITSSVDLVHQGKVHLHMDNNSTGACGSYSPQSYDADIPLTGYSSTIYNVDNTGCGGNQWDIGGTVSIGSGVCGSYASGGNCSYTVTVTAHHGGVSGQCQDTQTKTFTLNYVQPLIYMQLSQLSNFNEQGKSAIIVGLPGQAMSAMLGTQSGMIAQTVNCSQSIGACTANGLYSNGLSATSMIYDIWLNSGDELKKGTVNFTPSNGYTFSDFTIIH